MAVGFIAVLQRGITAKSSCNVVSTWLLARYGYVDCNLNDNVAVAQCCKHEAGQCKAAAAAHGRRIQLSGCGAGATVLLQLAKIVGRCTESLLYLVIYSTTDGASSQRMTTHGIH
jgi:hypothetical protein